MTEEELPPPQDDYLFDPSSASGDPTERAAIEKLEGQLRSRRYSPMDPAERARGASRRHRQISSSNSDNDQGGPEANSRKVVVLSITVLAIAAAIFAVVRGAQVWPAGGPPVVASSPKTEPSNTSPPPPSFAVTRVAGNPQVGHSPITDSGGRLGVGAWLETDETSRADIALGGIGTVHVDARSRVRLVNTTPTQHRLELACGVIEAKVIAPPRLFIVDTPAARATDLGCAYRLEVGPDGAGLLRVTSGAVELEGHGHSAWVPAGAACETRPNKGPSSPYFEDSLDAFKDALHRFESDSTNPDDPPAGLVESLVSAARPRDTLTLWHLKARTHGRPNEILTTRIHELVPGAKDAGSIDDLVTHW